MGLANPHSKTQAMPIFLEYLDKVGTEEWVLFCLGEVDCGFVIWYRAEKYATPIEEQFEQSLQNYFQLIHRYLEKVPPAQVIVCSVPLPTIGDHQRGKGEVANKRLGIMATQRERTDLTIRYNYELRRFCARIGAQYLDCDQDTLDAEMGVVSAEFLNKNPLDHHLDPEKLAHLVVPKLHRIGLR